MAQLPGIGDPLEKMGWRERLSSALPSNVFPAPVSLKQGNRFFWLTLDMPVIPCSLIRSEPRSID